MGIPDVTEALGTQIVLRESISQIAQDACVKVAASCNADCAMLWLDQGTLAPTAQARRPTGRANAAKVLSAFAQSAIGTLQNEHRIIHDGVPMVLVMQRLEKQSGTIAIAVSEAQWAHTQSVWEPMVDLVSMLLEQGASRHQVEVDLAEVNQRVKRLSRDVEMDVLTGVENKASFESKCHARLTNDMRPAALLAIDLDDFKKVNDIYGHQFGDTFLRCVGETILAALPGSTIIGRTGGDEFCALVDIPQAGRSYLNTIVRNIRLSLQRSTAMLGKPDLGGITIGVSLFPNQATSYTRLFKQADCALYASKRTERNGTRVYSSDLDGFMEQANLREGHADELFEKITTYFQPIYDLGTGQRAGVELLARWQDSSGALRDPDSFAWMFKDHRFAAILTTHIVEKALDNLAQHDALRDVPALWINVTDNDLLNADFVFDLQAVFSYHDLTWDRVVIEINEDSVLGERYGLAFNALKEIRRRGGRIALDDFGAGQTGLAHVCQWPVDIVKIDRSIVQKVGIEPGADVAVEALVMVAQKLNQEVIAEGIELPTQIPRIQNVGCTLAQGYALSKPMSAAELKANGTLLKPEAAPI